MNHNNYLIRTENNTSFNFERPNQFHKINYKNPYDNRLYFGIRYKTSYHHERKIETMFLGRLNHSSLVFGFYIPNMYWQRRFSEYMTTVHYGSNKNGVRKFYALTKNITMARESHKVGFLIAGGLLGFIANCWYYRKLQLDLWLKTHYGEKVPIREPIGFYSFRYYLRMIKVYFLRYKLGSIYYFSKHNPFDMNTGMSTVYVIERILRGERFFKRRDKSFDFMRVGEIELFEYDDPLP